MKFLYGHHERNIDGKNRVQIPTQLRSRILPDADGSSFYVTLGEYPHTLSLFPERYFEQLAQRIETEFMPGEKSRQFELQFFSLAASVEPDSQGRILLPDLLRRKARLGEEVVLVGQKNRIDIFNKEDFTKYLGINFDDDEWPDWGEFMRMRPNRPSTPGTDGNGASR